MFAAARSADKSPDLPSSDQILRHVEEILSSDVFAGAPRQKRFLGHLVDRYLQGRTGELKEYTLGVEVFDRGPSFDPRLDPIVRVEASRLRGRLRKYYASNAPNGVQIDLPRGAYLLSFSSLPPVLAPVAEVKAAPAARYRTWAFAAVAVIVVTAAMLAVGLPARIGTEQPNFRHFKRLTTDSVCTSPSFAPDGNALVYACRERGNWHLFTRNLTETEQAVNLTPDSTTNDHQPAWAPDGTRIAFRSDRDGGGIFLMEVGSGRIQRVTRYGYHPSWSPDGGRIAFSTATFADPAENPPPARTSFLHIANVGNGAIQMVKLPPDAGDALQPAWSPVNDEIAFWGSDFNGHRDIWIADASGTRTRRITDDPWTDWSPSWSRDGRHIYFSSDRGGAMNIWRSELGTDDLVPLTTPSSYSGLGVLSTDGKRFAYVRRMVTSKLFRVRLDPEKGTAAAAPEELTSGDRRVREPDLSPDGQSMVVRIQDPQEDLAILNSQGEIRRLTNDSHKDRAPRWSPDGRQIAFLSNRSGAFEVWITTAAGGEPRQLTKQGAVDYWWTPNGSLLGFSPGRKPTVLEPPGRAVPELGLPPGFAPIAWSSDGRHVAGTLNRRDPLTVLNLDTKNQWELPAAPASTAFWLSDNRHLLFTSAKSIDLADVVTRTTRPIVFNLDGQSHARFAVARGANVLYFVRSQDEQDIWIGNSE